jgi:histidinol-phosphate aminotransferase
MGIRRNILNIKPYQPGKPIEELERELGLKNIIKLASNENPLGPSPKAVEAISSSVGKINRYPESGCFYLRHALAKNFWLKPENFIIGNGSDEIIVLALRAFINPGDEVIVASPTFLIYEIQARACGAGIVTVPLKNFRYDLSKMKNAITPKTKIVFIANPDNPTGTYVTQAEVSEFMNNVSKKTLVFFDEAYFEFAKNFSDFPQTLKFFKNGNVIITRSFSKAYGLAGLRVGYGISSPGIVNCLERVREPFNVNSLAQVAACAALKDNFFLQRTIKITEEGKKFLYWQFDKLGLRYIPSATNFILVDVRREGTGVFKSLLKEGVIVRDMKAWKLNNFIRVTVGTKKENERFIKALDKILRETSNQKPVTRFSGFCTLVSGFSRTK